jgi:hypothetical protein
MIRVGAKMMRKAMIPVAAFASALALPMNAGSAQFTPHARDIDEYKTPDLSAHTDNLDNWAIELQNDPTSQGYVIAYARRSSEALKAANNQIEYIVNVRSIDPARLAVKYGGYRAVPAIELWILPNGVSPPAPRPARKRKT